MTQQEIEILESLRKKEQEIFDSLTNTRNVLNNSPYPENFRFAVKQLEHEHARVTQEIATYTEEKVLNRVPASLEEFIRGQWSNLEFRDMWREHGRMLPDKDPVNQIINKLESEFKDRFE